MKFGLKDIVLFSSMALLVSAAETSDRSAEDKKPDDFPKFGCNECLGEGGIYCLQGREMTFGLCCDQTIPDKL